MISWIIVYRLELEVNERIAATKMAVLIQIFWREVSGYNLLPVTYRAVHVWLKKGLLHIWRENLSLSVL